MRIRVFLTVMVALLLGTPSIAQNDDLYDDGVLRTFSLEFSQSGWWAQLTANYESETNLEATLSVGDRAYEGVGCVFAAIRPINRSIPIRNRSTSRSTTRMKTYA